MNASWKTSGDGQIIGVSHILLKNLIASPIGLNQSIPWQSLHVYESVQKNLVERLAFWKEALKVYPHYPSNPKSINSPNAYVAKVTEILDICRQAQVIHLRRLPLKELYKMPPHPEQPFTETVRLPFKHLFIEFSEPLEVEAGPDFGKDQLVALVLHEIRPQVIKIFCIWLDCEFTELIVDTALLPEYAQMPCDLETKPPTSEPCWREKAIKEDPSMETFPVCPATMDPNVHFPCAHRWRDKIVGNVFINIITILNARNLVLERVQTSKKRLKRAQKEGYRLPSEYRKVDLEWFTPIRASSRREGGGEGSGRQVSTPYLRRGHFRQYAPGKFTWVTPHVCRADLMKNQDVNRHVYKA